MGNTTTGTSLYEAEKNYEVRVIEDGDESAGIRMKMRIKEAKDQQTAKPTNPTVVEIAAGAGGDQIQAAIDGANAWQKLIYVTLPMMRNIISITMLYSLIVTFADFDIVRILTNGGPQDSTHLFATYAFTVGIQSGNIPRGASVSLFMFPILATLAFFVLRDVMKRNKEMA